MTETSRSAHAHLYTAHPRQWRTYQFVYPVLSRRSKGLSIGINLNPDKVCNWDCVYCQVDRHIPPVRTDVDLPQIRAELDAMLHFALSGELWTDPSFADVPADLRRINDIAFSGDGEPTTYTKFDEAVALAAELKAAHHLPDTKIITLSNMTMAHRPQVQRGFAIMDQHNGEIWAKLEAGTQAYYELVDRSAVKLDRVLNNILEAGRIRPLVIQSMFMSMHGVPAPLEEFDAYLARLRWLVAEGCRIKLVQLYTIARNTAESYATPLTAQQLQHLSTRFAAALPTIPREVYE